MTIRPRLARPEGIYRRVTVRMYCDEKFMRLSPMLPSGQALWVYLLTGPQTGPIPGVFVAGHAALAENLSWSPEDFGKAFGEVIREGLAEFDHRTRLWFIPNAIRHNVPPNPNVVKSWRSSWSLLPECELRDRIQRQLQAVLSAVSDAFGKAFAEASGKAFGKPSPKDSGNGMAKQDTGYRKQEQDKRMPAVTSSAAPTADPPGFADFWTSWPASPRKQDRKKCALVWKRKGFSASLPTVLAHIEAMRKSKTWLDGFEPAPLTYLNNERWLDGTPLTAQPEHSQFEGAI